MTTNQTPISPARLEHVNLTVSDPERTASMLVDLFGRHVRWEGGSIHDGHTIHVGTDDDYLALCSPHEYALHEHALHEHALHESSNEPVDSYRQVAGLNHIAVVVNDLDAIEQAVIGAGFEPTNHGDYEPGRRFYFRDHDHVEYEIVDYEIVDYEIVDHV